MSHVVLQLPAMTYATKGAIEYCCNLSNLQQTLARWPAFKETSYETGCVPNMGGEELTKSSMRIPHVRLSECQTCEERAYKIINEGPSGETE